MDNELCTGVSPEADSGVRLEGSFKCFAPLGGAECRMHSQCTIFAPGFSKLAVELLVFLCFVVHNLPQLHMHVVTFSPL